MDVRPAPGSHAAATSRHRIHDLPARPGTALRAAPLAAAAVLIATLMHGPGTARATDAQPHPAEPDVEVEAMVDDQGSIGLLTLPLGVRHSGGRIPAVVLLSDNAAPDQRAFRYIEHLRHAGIAALEVQLYETSEDGVSTGPSLDRNLEANRLRRALLTLQRVHGVAFSGFAAIGFGRGAHSLALARPANDTGIDLAARVLLYPGCRMLRAALPERDEGPAPSRAPVLILHGDHDTANMQMDCDGLAERFASIGVASRVIRYRGATYGWDIPALGISGTASLEGPDGQRVRATPWHELSDMSAAQAIAFVAAAFDRAGR